MKVNGKRVLVCTCEGTMTIDGECLGRTFDTDPPHLYRHLCRSEAEAFRAALGEDLMVACMHEAPLFAALAREAGAPEPVFVDIRERAGWSDEGARATPKMAALIAAAAVKVEPTPAASVRSDGVTLVLARDEAGLEAARRLAGDRAVTCVLTAALDCPPPPVRRLALFAGRITAARGHLGAYAVSVTGLAAPSPSARGRLDFTLPVDTGELTADLILDLSGSAPLFAGGRDGYLRADPGRPAEVERALAGAAGLVGEFEKPRYIRVDAGRCAHKRNELVGCTRCLDACPTSSLAPKGDAVEVDALACSGHGACSAVCPTGAITYDLPAGNGVFRRLRTLLQAWRAAGGEAPQLLLHDAAHGSDMIAALAHAGPGLPAAVLPLAVERVTAVGLDLVLTAIAHGAARVWLLAGPSEDLSAQREAASLADAILGGLGLGDGRIAILAENDPLRLGEALRRPAPQPLVPADYLPVGERRQLLSLALSHLARLSPAAPAIIPLPAGAPFGRVVVDAAGCTLCLACVGACPTKALASNPDKPQLTFMEGQCVQCGLCRATCPEKAVTLEPRLALAPARQVLKEEEPYSCIRCGKPFGTKSSIEKMVERLAGHSMFAGTGRLDLIRMCDNCRVVAQVEAQEGLPARPVPRTTDDYR